MKLLPLFIIVISFLPFISYNGINSNKSSSTQITSIINKRVPHFTGYLLSDSIVDENFLKNKVVLLNFMFIGCRPCMKELPKLDALKEKYGKKNFSIITVIANAVEDIRSYQGIGDTSKVFYKFRMERKYIKINTPIIAECKTRIDTRDLLIPCVGNISKSFQVDAYPISYLVDNNGIIRKKYYGPIIDTLIYNDLQRQIETLLK